MSGGASSQLGNIISPMPGQNPFILNPVMPGSPIPGMSGKGSSSGGGGNTGSPVASPVSATGTPGFGSPVTASSSAPAGNITSGIGGGSLSPQIMSLIQQLSSSA